ncbi:hypothetical protein KEM60_00151 [Austwickia sp. TVS 96-490-7B]|uniref:energy-coupling factor transporter transmembrane component T family protein n=1 Tax=Austwickia sp. TVS 96-490-7B TaxID=2830843 RepID=UPI001C57F4E5|nr:energy-coupling factor transporter transmembrane component T [Austwickia sp. TVS 96-490-7B]MBW3083968.1 hypothetical protein [Austwickia sp. TVS 96-490-7B]
MWGLLRRCGPLSLMASSLVLVVTAPAIRTFTQALISAGTAILLLVIVVGPVRFPWARILPGVLAVLSVTWSNWLLAATPDGMTAVTAGLRVGFFVIPGIIFASFVDPSTVGDHLGQRLRLPARPVLAFVAALQRFEDLQQEWEDIRRIRRIRGLASGRGPVALAQDAATSAVMLIVEAIRAAGRMTVAMEARGYSAAAASGEPRTWAEPAPWTGADSTLVIMNSLLAALPVALLWCG